MAAMKMMVSWFQMAMISWLRPPKITEATHIATRESMERLSSIEEQRNNLWTKHKEKNREIGRVVAEAAGKNLILLAFNIVSFMDSFPRIPTWYFVFFDVIAVAILVSYFSGYFSVVNDWARDAVELNQKWKAYSHMLVVFEHILRKSAIAIDRIFAVNNDVDVALPRIIRLPNARFGHLLEKKIKLLERPDEFWFPEMMMIWIIRGLFVIGLLQVALINYICLIAAST